MKLNHVLVIYKSHMGGEVRGTAATADLKMRHRRHDETLARVKEALDDLRIRHKFIDRDEFKGRSKCDLLITVGGDGTLLATAHGAGATPILGVNSMPDHSVGFFCAATAGDIGKILKNISEGKTRPANLPLIEASVDSRRLPVLALNDVLFSGLTPAEMVRYRITLGSRSEEQRSSGVWISAGPGSTAAICSAGGKPLPIESKRLQYVVREPCAAGHRRCGLRRGVLKAGERISITSETGDAMIYIDGPNVSCPLPAGARLSVRIAQKSLSLFV
ncbi:MAG: NAD(+)/NADH kinase [Pseudomonadota bacterium]